MWEIEVAVVDELVEVLFGIDGCCGDHLELVLEVVMLWRDLECLSKTERLVSLVGGFEIDPFLARKQGQGWWRNAVKSTERLLTLFVSAILFREKRAKANYYSARVLGPRFTLEQQDHNRQTQPRNWLENYCIDLQDIQSVQINYFY